MATTEKPAGQGGHKENALVRTKTNGGAKTIESKAQNQYEVSLFKPGSLGVPCDKISLADLIRAIQTGELKKQGFSFHREAIMRLRALPPAEEKAIRELKNKELPAVAVSGVFPLRESIKGKKPEPHSGLVQLDFDKVTEPEAVREKLREYPHVAAAFLSPSGRGVKALVRISPEQHKEAFRALVERFSDQLGIEADTSTGNPNRLCFLSYDPDAWLNLNAAPCEAQGLRPTPSGESGVKKGKEALDLDDLPLPDVSISSARLDLKGIDPDLPYHEWLRVAAGLRHQFPGRSEEAYALFDEWSARGRKYAGLRETGAKWTSLVPLPNGREPTTYRTILKLRNDAERKKQLQGLPSNSVILPSKAGNHLVECPDTARQLANALRTSNIYSFQGKEVVVATRNGRGDTELCPLGAEGAATRFQEHVHFYEWKIVKEKCALVEVPRPAKEVMRELLSGGVFAENLRGVVLVTDCPLLVENRDGSLETLGPGYHPDHRVLVGSDVPPTPEVPPDEAASALLKLLDDFDCVSEGDLARMLADYLTPALVMGDLLGSQAPLSFTEADQSQAGKGYHQRCVRNLYRAPAKLITQRKGGVGSLDESISSALLSGKTFISLDNIRGNLDSTLLEAVLTAENDVIGARAPYRPEGEVSVRRRVIQMTSNQMTTTEDLANRANMVRIRKRPKNYRFRPYKEGDLEAHIHANQPYYLGCVFALIRQWHAEGKQQTNESRHSRRTWSRTVDAILQIAYFGTVAKLMDGYAEAKERLSSPSRSCLRSICALIGSDPHNEWSPTGIARLILSRRGEERFPVPGLRQKQLEEDEEKEMARAVGKVLGDEFRKALGDQVHCEGYTITRRIEPFYDEVQRKDRKRKWFSFAISK